jgi:hypothetical protein
MRVIAIIIVANKKDFFKTVVRNRTERKLKFAVCTGRTFAARDHVMQRGSPDAKVHGARRHPGRCSTIFSLRTGERYEYLSAMP